MGNILKSLTGGDILSAGSGLLGGIIGGISANHAAKKQYEYQRKLNEQSQEFSEKNATTAYERQRELTQDNPLLQLQGMRNAGLSTSFSQGSSVAGAANVDQGATPSPGSAPNVPSVMQSMVQGSEMGNVVSRLLLNASQRRQIDAVADNQEIKNDFEFQQQLADLRLKKAQARTEEEKSIYQRMENEIFSKYGERKYAAETGGAESDEAKKAEEAAIVGILRRYTDNQQMAELNIKRQTLVNLRESAELTRKEREKIDAQIREIDQNIRESASRIEFNHAQTLSLNNENAVTGDKDVQKARKRLIIDASDLQNVEAEAARLTKKEVLAEAERKAASLGPQSVQEWTWRIVNNWDNASTWDKIKCYVALTGEVASPLVGAFGTGVGAGLGARVGGAFTPKPVKVRGFGK